jgi:predicted ribosomally synthesized peptide with SipW-like signal peptide
MKKIVGLSIAAVLIIALITGGTFAFFSDTETSASNTFTAGTLDLKVSNDAATYLDGVTSTWGSTNCKPGDSWNGTVTLKNDGSITADHVEIKFANAVTNYVSAAVVATDTGDPDIADMSTVMRITAMSYGGTSILATMLTYLDAVENGGNNDSILELNELNGKTINATTYGEALSVPAASGASTKAFTMTVSIPTSVNNGIQGDSVTTTVTFGLFQDSSQHLP